MGHGGSPVRGPRGPPAREASHLIRAMAGPVAAQGAHGGSRLGGHAGAKPSPALSERLGL